MIYFVFKTKIYLYIYQLVIKVQNLFMKEFPKYFILFPNVVPVKGKVKSALYDLQKGAIIPIPNILLEVISKFRIKELSEIINEFAPENPKLITQYIDFLKDKNLGFFTDEVSNFPQMKFDWYATSDIQNAIIEFNESFSNIFRIFEELDGLSCSHIELRVDAQNYKYLNLKALFNQIDNFGFKSIYLIIEHNKQLNDIDILELYESFSKIKSIVIFNYLDYKQDIKYPDNILYTENNFHTTLFKQSYPLNRYIVNIPYFTEALNFNTYYNRKVCISQNGDIKNCLRHTKSFGNIYKDKLEGIVKSKSFQELWHASVDKITGIKDSELRYGHFLTNDLERLDNGLYKLIE